MTGNLDAATALCEAGADVNFVCFCSVTITLLLLLLQYYSRNADDMHILARGNRYLHETKSAWHMQRRATTKQAISWSSS